MSFKALPIARAPADVPLPVRRAVENVAHAAATDPALSVMVDFVRDYPIMVGPERHIDEALQDMRSSGVRTLLVTRQRAVVGLITAYDIQGERPLQFIQSSDCVHDTCLHRDVTVGDIMTPLEQLPVLEFDDVAVARVGDLLETFKATAQTHLVVIESESDDAIRVRGLISCARLERQLGLNPGAAPQHRIEREVTLLSAAQSPR